jgi:hypothetical protein
MTREVMQQALEALVTAEAGLADIGDADREPTDDLAWCEERAAQALAKPRAAIVALKAALANELFGNSEQLVMRPEREWVGLTDREREECEEWLGHDVSSQVFYVIEYKLKERNK